MIKERVRLLVEKVEQFSEEAPVKKEDKRKTSLTNLSLMPFGLLTHNLKSFFTLSSVFAPLMAIWAFAMHSSFICGFSDLAVKSPFACTAPNEALYITFILLRLLLIVVFLKSWFNVAIKKRPINKSELLLIKGQDWKLFAVFLTFVLINIAPLMSFLLLYYREPNPNWIIESLYFAVVSCGFLLPFLAICFYCIPAYILENRKIPSPVKIYAASIDNGLKLLISFVIVLLFSVLFVIYFSGFAQKLMSYNVVLYGILCELLYDIVLLSIFALFINFSVVLQKELCVQEKTPQND